jgi:hypothetical protein
VAWTQVEAYVSDNAGGDPGIPTFPPELSDHDFRRIRLMRETALILLVALLVVGVTGFLGVRSTTVSSTSNGYELSVKHAWVTRGGMDADWRLRVRRTGGFGRPVTVAYPRDFLDSFEVEAVFPEPVSQTSAPPFLYLTFARPHADTLDVTFPARAQATITDVGPHDAVVLVLVDGRQVARTSYRSWVVP